MNEHALPPGRHLWNTAPWKWPTVAKIGLGLVVGTVLGLIAYLVASRIEGGPAWVEGAVNQVAKPIGSLFLSMVFLVVVPLLSSAIVLGVLEMKDVRSLGRVGLRSMVLTAILVVCSVAVALGAVNILRPGTHLKDQDRARLTARFSENAEVKKAEAAVETSKTQKSKPFLESVVSLLPKNPLGDAAALFTPAASSNAILSLMIVSVIVGLAMLGCDPEKVAPLKGLVEATFEVSMKVIGFAMAIAPVAVACLMFAATSTLGWDLLGMLALYAGTVVGALGIQMFVVYPLALVVLGRRSPWFFFRETREAIITAFATSSSNATLPVSLRVASENLRLPDRIGRFVLTVGATANQNGTALYEGVTVLFLAQVFGVDLTVGQQLSVAAACILAGVGTAGVPGGSLPFVAAVVSSLGIPAESVAIILGIDRILDMCRTTLNVTGDLVIADVVAAWERPGKREV